MQKEIFHEAQIYVRCKREILISLLPRTVCAENRRLLRIVSCDITFGRHCPPSPRALPFCFQDGFILDLRQA